MRNTDLKNKMATLLYYSTKIDWWLPTLMVFILIPSIAMLLWIGMVYCIVSGNGFDSVWGGFQFSDFIRHKRGGIGVHTSVKWMWYPIENIKEARKIKSILAAPAMSFIWVSIKLKKGTTKFAVPLEISPKDRDKFIQDLLKIIHDIKVIQ